MYSLQEHFCVFSAERLTRWVLQIPFSGISLHSDRKLSDKIKAIHIYDLRQKNLYGTCLLFTKNWLSKLKSNYSKSCGTSTWIKHKINLQKFTGNFVNYWTFLCHWFYLKKNKHKLINSWDPSWDNSTVHPLQYLIKSLCCFQGFFIFFWKIRSILCTQLHCNCLWVHLVNLKFETMPLKTKCL